MALFNYGNALYYGLPCKEVTILDRNKYDSLTLARHQLHWLPVEERIKFKLLTLVYECLNDQAPLYLQTLLEYQELVKETRLRGK